ncbi:MAG: prolyl oligopeptidase family serine peptidase [Planctomycetota bacterium]
MLQKFNVVLGAVFIVSASIFAAEIPDDPYLWLEEVLGKRALEFVEKQNATTVKELEARPEFAPIKEQVLSILNSKERIPYVTKMGAHYYNLWRDATNPRGVWRRTSLEEYQQATPAWETVLDIDDLAKTESENWVWHGSSTFPPKYERALITFSRGGGDAVVVREFDLKSKQFIKDGFNLPEAKSRAVWRDENTVYVGTNFGPDSLTDSGYPRIVKRWSRGTPLTAATPVFEGQKTDVSVGISVDFAQGTIREFIGRDIAFYNSENFMLVNNAPVKIDLPNDTDLNVFNDWALIKLRSDWTVGGATYKGGSLLATKLDALMKGERKFTVLFEPKPTVALAHSTQTRGSVVLTLSDNVRSRVVVATPGAVGWTFRDMKLPGIGTASVSPVDEYESDDVWVIYQDFLTPDSLYINNVNADTKTALKSRPAFFKADGIEVRQNRATSKDGTQVPYFVLGKTEAIQSGSAPTILYGYGGFEISMQPFYSAGVGKAWLERGGVYVLSNIRGGGEFGPAWHQAALKSKRQNAYDDFESIAEDLAKRNITPASHLGIMGGSNGGLLVSTVAVQRPELFKAVVCQVPLTDMRRFHKLLAGASWMAEYGDPDKPEEWAYISKYSPYQNAKKDAKYPRILFTTSTRDDRVHPAHARKLFAKMQEMGHDVLYYENTEGGHAGAANHEQKAKMVALEYSFLWKMLK